MAALTSLFAVTDPYLTDPYLVYGGADGDEEGGKLPSQAPTLGSLPTTRCGSPAAELAELVDHIIDEEAPGSASPLTEPGDREVCFVDDCMGGAAEDDVEIVGESIAPEEIASAAEDSESSGDGDEEPRWLDLAASLTTEDRTVAENAEVCGAFIDGRAAEGDGPELECPQYIPRLAQYLVGHPQALITKNRKRKGKGAGKRYFGETRSEDVMADKVVNGCWACGKLDHESQDCQFKRCFVCSVQGHELATCNFRQMFCQRCRGRGHLMESCPETAYADPIWDDLDSCRCLRCGREGHLNCGSAPAVSSAAPGLVPIYAAGRQNYGWREAPGPAGPAGPAGGWRPRMEGGPSGLPAAWRSELRPKSAGAPPALLVPSQPGRVRGSVGDALGGDRALLVPRLYAHGGPTAPPPSARGGEPWEMNHGSASPVVYASLNGEGAGDYEDCADDFVDGPGGGPAQAGGGWARPSWGRGDSGQWQAQAQESWAYQRSRDSHAARLLAWQQSQNGKGGKGQGGKGCKGCKGAKGGWWREEHSQGSAAQDGARQAGGVSQTWQGGPSGEGAAEWGEDAAEQRQRGERGGRKRNRGWP